MFATPAPAYAQGAVPECYALAYDSIEPRFERSALIPKLRLLAGEQRGHADPGDTAAIWRSSYWWTSQDSLGVMLSNGQFELWLRVSQLGKALRGWAEYRSDVAEASPPRAQVTASRIPCDA
jgi:hypothetical protein